MQHRSVVVVCAEMTAAPLLPPPPEDLPLSRPCPHPPTLALTLRLACLLTSVVVLATAPLVLPMPSRSFLAVAVIIVGINLKGTNTMAEKRAEMPRRRLPPPPSSSPPKWWVRHPRRLPGRSTTATDRRPCASPSPAPAPPPNNMLIATALFEPDTAALLPWQHCARRPTPAKALMPRQRPRRPNNATAHPPPPSSLPATDAPPTLQHAHRPLPTPTMPLCGHCTAAAMTMPQHARCRFSPHCHCHLPPQPHQHHLSNATPTMQRCTCCCSAAPPPHRRRKLDNAAASPPPPTP